MQIVLANTGDEPNVLNKRIFNNITLIGSLKQDSNIIDPSILIEIENPTSYNYCFIPEFGRYYFIRDIRSVRYNLWEIVLHVDVLMSHKDDIKQCSVMLDNSETTGITYYIQNGVFINTCKDKTDIVQFSNGFNENGEYILITAGGIAT